MLKGNKEIGINNFNSILCSSPIYNNSYSIKNLEDWQMDTQKNAYFPHGSLLLVNFFFK